MTGAISTFMPLAQENINVAQRGVEATNMPGTINALMPVATGALLNRANTKISQSVNALGDPLSHMIQGPTASGFQARAIHGDKLRQAEDAVNNIGVSGRGDMRARAAEDAGRASIAAAQTAYTDNMANQQQAQGQAMRQALGSMNRGRSNSALASGLSNAMPQTSPQSTAEIQQAAQGLSGAMQAAASIRQSDFGQSAEKANQKMGVADRYRTTIDPSLYAINRENAIQGTNTGIEENLASAIPYLGGSMNTGDYSTISGGQVGGSKPDIVSRGVPENTPQTASTIADANTGPKQEATDTPQYGEWQGPINQAPQYGEWQGPLDPGAAIEDGSGGGGLPAEQGASSPSRPPASAKPTKPLSSPYSGGGISSQYKPPMVFGYGGVKMESAPQDFGDFTPLGKGTPSPDVSISHGMGHVGAASTPLPADSKLMDIASNFQKAKGGKKKTAPFSKKKIVNDMKQEQQNLWLDRQFGEFNK